MCVLTYYVGIRSTIESLDWQIWCKTYVPKVRWFVEAQIGQLTDQNAEWFAYLVLKINQVRAVKKCVGFNVCRISHFQTYLEEIPHVIFVFYHRAWYPWNFFRVI